MATSRQQQREVYDDGEALVDVSRLPTLADSAKMKQERPPEIQRDPGLLDA